MSFVPRSNDVFRSSALVLLFLAASIFAVAADQHKNDKPAPAPKPAAPHTSAPRPSTTRPSTPSRTSTTTAKPGTTTRTTTPTGKTGTVGKTNTGTAGKTGTSPAGKTGTVSGMNKTGTMGKGAGGTAKTTVNRTPPGRQVALKGGGSASIRPNGQIRSINRNGMHIDHGLNGSRRIESTHNGARIVTTGRNSGYVQRAYVTRNGRTYVSRTVVVNHVTYTRVYRSYSYHGYCCYYGYHPAFYYHPAYYGWAYNPWAAPVYYGWGWGGAPWYGYYGGYFAPYPVYPSAAFWLTDYLIASSLQAAYQAHAAAANAAADNATADNAATDQAQAGNDAPAANATVTLSPEVKEAIAEEVKAQLAAEQNSASQPAANGQQAQPSPTAEEVPPALDPARRTFVVASDLAVTTSEGEECQLTEGDVITRITDTPDDDRKVTVSVSASKKADCAPGKQVAVAVDDLQEMHNHFQEQLDNGMKELSSKQGTGGLPKAPDTNTVASDVPPPPPDADAEKTLQDQQASADQVESQVVKEAFSQGS